ncbi:hypothetical protein [Nocardioides sp. GY 10127]|uniref:hypothetical protein n=1 Tax=Nocardioides sp. GY 10127 TaxID=2569762 RepID=UPI0010A764CF|nr:hypothetical protein [Nocardioides sp. GY 10127]TIC84313.1 hypothetical protein E8D37_05945 [Nocardioides sp. GY 10127]
MTEQQDFDDLYAEARERLLLQAYALTGDLRASRGAVRETFVSAWQHWRQATRGSDPEAWVRPRAWALAHRRHTTHVWHREKSLDPGVRRTLEALSSLSWTQRRVLVLVHLAAVSLPDAARELGLTVDAFTSELQRSTAAVALAAEVPSSHVPIMLRGLEPALEGVRWSRAARLRRAGTTRRRTAVVVGVGLVAAAVVVSGVVVDDPDGARPRLDRALTGVSTAGAGAGVEGSADGSSTSAADAVALVDDDMLAADDLEGVVAGKGWKVLETDHNVDGDGLVLPCQQTRYADEDVQDALVRTLRSAGSGAERLTATQMTEESADALAARASYTLWSQWVSGCTDTRTQLLAVRDVAGVGDQAFQVVLRDWSSPTTTEVVQVARTGRYLTVVALERRGTATGSLPAAARTLSSAVSGLCGLVGAGACGGSPTLTETDPVPVAEVPTMLVDADLPPVTGVSADWAGSETDTKVATNPAATRCDETSFSGRYRGVRFTDTATRTFLIPDATKLPVEFGLTETVGALPVARAKALVTHVAARMSSCSDRDPGTKVRVVRTRTDGADQVSVWRVTVEVTARKSVVYDMALVRHGGALAQVGFVPAGRRTFADGAFTALAERALARLRAGVEAG